MNNSITSLASHLQSAVSDAQTRLSTTHNQIASGKKDLSDQDTSIVARLSAQASSQSGVQSNIKNANNVVDVAQSGLSSIASILTQMQSLATQVLNGLNSDTDQTMLYTTFSNLNSQIAKIAATTSINGNNLLSGNQTISVLSGSDGVNNKTTLIQGVDIASLQTALNALSFAVESIDTTSTSTVTGSSGGAGTYAQQSISFNAMANGDSATVGGLTFTANSNLTAAQVASIFYQKIANSANNAAGTFTNSFQGGYNLTDPGVGSSVTFTGMTTGPMSSLAVGATLSARTPLSSSNVSGSFGSDSSAALISVSFPPVVAGDTATVGGLTFTATSNLTPTELASIFAAKINSNTNSSYGSFSGSFVGGFTAVASGALTLTGNSNGARTLDVSGRTANATITQSSDVTTLVTGSYATSGNYAQQLIQFRALSAGETATFGDLTLTASANMTAKQVAVAFLNKVQYESDPPTSTGSFNSTSFSYSSQFSLNVYNVNSGQLYAYANSAGSRDLIPASGSVTGASGNTALSASDVTTLVTGTASTDGAYAQQTVQFYDMFTGETVTVGGLTFTANTFVNATTVANNFSARMSNSSSSPSGGYFSGS
jgi:flagellin-like hook-associated protein FlgL